MENTGSTKDALDPSQLPDPIKQTVGIYIKDPAYRRLLESIAFNLDLTPVLLDDDSLDSDTIFDLELIIAEEPVARRLRPIVDQEQSLGELIRPALIAVVPSPVIPAPAVISPVSPDSSTFDAILALPENPALLAAQLGVALYAHRAFARRYQSALEELNLNRNIFKSVTSGISVANAQLPDMPLMYVNPAFEVMTGYHLEEIEGQNCRFLQREERDQPGLTLIREAIIQQRETTAVLRNFRKDGSSFWNQLSLSPIRNREGVLTHVVGIQMDVTERVEFEIALRESEKLAAVGRLASAIAHEINNPLEAVMNLLYLSRTNLPDHPENTDSRRYLEQADLEVQRIKQITVQSLRFYKQSSDPEAVTCHDLIAPILDIYNPRFTNFHVDVTYRERSTQHLVCLASEIRQVLSNLISNAVDAMRSGGGRLTLRTREATDWRSGANGIAITVADTGSGMSPAIQAKIYKAFYTTKGISGTGLGLWISSEIIRRHHGRIKVRSREGSPRSGTVFCLFLPFQAAAGVDSAAPEIATLAS